MALEEKEAKKLTTLCTKITNVFNDFYITKQGYVISLDTTKPFILMIDDSYVELFIKALGKFSVLHIANCKEFKKELKDYYEIFTPEDLESSKVVEYLSEKIKLINKCIDWEEFLLSDNSEENERLILSLFQKNNYIDFKPKNFDGPEVILTKSLLPLVSEKNYTKLHYSTQKIDSELFLIVFDFEFEFFRIYMLHHFIPIDEGKKIDE